MSTFFQRLIDEQTDLRVRMVALNKFVASERFDQTSMRQQYLLQRQQEIMLQYHAILDWRIEDLVRTIPPGDQLR